MLRVLRLTLLIPGSIDLFLFRRDVGPEVRQGGDRSRPFLDYLIPSFLRTVFRPFDLRLFLSRILLREPVSDPVKFGGPSGSHII